MFRYANPRYVYVRYLRISEALRITAFKLTFKGIIVIHNTKGTLS